MKKELFIFFILPFQLNRGTYLRRISIKKDLFYPKPLALKPLPLATLPPGHGVHPSSYPFPSPPSPNPSCSATKGIGREREGSRGGGEYGTKGNGRVEGALFLRCEAAGRDRSTDAS